MKELSKNSRNKKLRKKSQKTKKIRKKFEKQKLKENIRKTKKSRKEFEKRKPEKRRQFHDIFENLYKNRETAKKVGNDSKN